MKTLAIAALGVALAMSTTLSAHRLDEYLQASRLSLLTDGVGVEVDLTPGSSVSAEVSAQIDTDGDRQLTAVEVERYARGVLADLVLEANGDALSLRLTGVQAPTIDEMMAGLGTIRITAVGDRPGIGRGRVRLHYRNNHQGPSSMYLVNALVPRDGSILVTTADPRRSSAGDRARARGDGTVASGPGVAAGRRVGRRRPGCAAAAIADRAFRSSFFFLLSSSTTAGVAPRPTRQSE